MPVSYAKEKRRDINGLVFLFAVGTAITDRPPHRSGRAQLRHPAPTGSLATRSVSSRLVARGPALVTRFPGSVPGACFAGPHSSRSPPFAPPAPPPVARFCSLASSLLWQSQTSRVRASSASTPRLPDADPRYFSAGQTRDLPVPAQRASTHARVFDHAGPGGHLR
jgi:hypothetical protein